MVEEGNHHPLGRREGGANHRLAERCREFILMSFHFISKKKGPPKEGRGRKHSPQMPETQKLSLRTPSSATTPTDVHTFRHTHRPKCSGPAQIAQRRMYEVGCPPAGQSHESDRLGRSAGRRSFPFVCLFSLVYFV